MADTAATQLETGERARRGKAKAFSRLKASPLSLAAMLILVVLLMATVFGPLIVPYPEDAEGSIHPDIRLQAPNWGHPFGTDELGRDVFSRVVLGARISMTIGVIVLIIGVSIGTVLGATAGFAGGRLNEAIMRCTDIMIAIPELILARAWPIP